MVITGLERENIIALLGYNSHSVKFILLNGTVQCFLVFFYSYTAFTVIFPGHFHHLKMRPSTVLAISSHPPLSLV